MTPGSLRNYHRDDVNDNANEIDAADNSSESNKKTTTSRSSECKTNITEAQQLMIIY